MWIVKILLPGNSWFDLATCDNIFFAAAVVSALVEKGHRLPQEIQVVGIALA